jgi:hypothetical protein
MQWLGIIMDWYSFVKCIAHAHLTIRQITATYKNN